MGAIAGMFAMGWLVFRGTLSKRISITWGIVGVGVSLFLLAFGALTAHRDVVHAALVIMGFFNGFALVGTLTSAMEFTTPTERGSYIGLWGLSIAFASGVASILGGQLVTSLIESGLFQATSGFSVIFVFEAAVSLASLWFLWNVDHPTFTAKISKDNFSSAMEHDMA